MLEPDRRNERTVFQANCVHCGKLIQARTEPGDDVDPRADFERRYSDHVIEEHDKDRFGDRHIEVVE